MRKLVPLSLSLVLLGGLACGGAGNKESNGIEQDPIEFEDPPEKPKDPNKPEKPSHLKLAAMTLNVSGQIVTISAEGKIESGGNHIGNITVAGEFLASNGGLFGTLMPDGTMVRAHVNLDRFKDIMVSESGVLTKKNEAGELVELNQISETGEVSENGVVGFSMEGPTEGRRAAMFVYLVLAGSAMDAQEKANAGKTPEPTETKQ